MQHHDRTAGGPSVVASRSLPRRARPRPTIILGICSILVAGCAQPAVEPLPPGQFAFAVFGDGPYRAWESARYRRVIDDVNQADLQWFLHVGDILWVPCTDDALLDRLQSMNRIRHPVIFTPGDNEWTDCHEAVAGGADPLDRLDRIRSIFYADPTMTLGAQPMRVETQRADTMFSEFIENVRWRRGGFVFATVHVVGSGNGLNRFPGRTAASDAEVERRTAAAVAWIDEAFRIAEAERSHGVVIAMHADMDLLADSSHRGHAPIVDRLTELSADYAGLVLLIHGDSHEFIVDHPLLDRATGQPLPRFTRLETFGSPDIGWVRVVVDSVAGRFVAFEPRLQPGWRFW